MSLVTALAGFLEERYGPGPVPLHEPRFSGKERAYVMETLDSTFVSSVGPFVNRFEDMLAEYTGAVAAVATVNGTSALHVALLAAGVRPGDLVVTQSLTFIATCNAISYCGATPLFADVDRATLGLSPQALVELLEETAERTPAGCRHRETDRPIRACVPMHTFGHPADLGGLLQVCEDWGLVLVEDAAESLGSLYKGRHTGTFGRLAALSFNGNKIITTGGGGMVLTNDADLAARVKHLTTTARVSRGFEFAHDESGFNYRLPNLNAALGCAQMERLPEFVAAKRELAAAYAGLFAGSDLEFVREPEGARSNYWLNAVVCPDKATRDAFLAETNAAGIMTRPAWEPMHRSMVYRDSPKGALPNTDWLADRLVNLPSSVPRGEAS